MEQILENLQNGDPVTAGAVIFAAVILFIILKMMTSMLKAVLVMVVLVVGAAVFYPDLEVIDKVKEGSKVALEKSKEMGEKAIEVASDPDNIETLKEKAAALAKKAHGE